MLFQRSDRSAEWEGHNNQATDVWVTRKLQDWNWNTSIRSHRILSCPIHEGTPAGTGSEDPTWIHIFLSLQTRRTHICEIGELDKRIQRAFKFEGQQLIEIFQASGVVGEDVVRLLREACQRKGVNIDVCALINVSWKWQSEMRNNEFTLQDTVGTMLACSFFEPNCSIGLIVGTGRLENVKHKSNTIHWFQ